MKTRLLTLVIVSLFTVSAAHGQVSLIASNDKKPVKKSNVTELELTISSAAEPVPALRYQFEFDYLKRKTGNAAIEYMKVAEHFPEELSKNVSDWWDLPIGELPDQAEFYINADQWYKLLLSASLCEQCDWQIPIRQEGIAALLPHLSTMRNYARAIALKARLEIANGHFDQAVETISVGFIMAQNTAKDGVLISQLVGIAISGIMLETVEDFIACDNAPNLYWAMAFLPRPMFVMNDVMDVERAWVFVSMPDLGKLEETIMTEQQAAAKVNEMMSTMTMLEGDSSGQQGLVAVLMLRDYAAAKAFLKSQGYSDDKLEQMPAVQAVMIYYFKDYKILSDDLYKWFAIPFPQAWPHLKETDKLISQRSKTDFKNPLVMVLPAIARVYENEIRLASRRCAVEAIEAIRMYAAENNKLPDSLADIKIVPVPKDPSTGKPFEYKKTASNKATLEAGNYEENARSYRYSLTLKADETK
ncbi:MAG: hypothetical protein JEZ07_10015 [Phycisphaerae bacterium]|nr:hypothetical protein [Phycisphaerae bacterium]